MTSPTREVLRFDEIPIERHWALSIRLHDELHHPEPWEICDDGCDALASDGIRILFGLLRETGSVS